MRIESIGWEADQLNGKTVLVTYPFTSNVVLRAYQFDAAFMPWQQGLFGGGGWSEVLFHVYLSPWTEVSHLGAGTYTDSAKQNLHGSNDNGHICRAILKGYIGGGQDCVNKALILSGLNISIPAGTSICMGAAHAGHGPVDFEVQGCLFLE